jgi:hypothetical protein
VRELVASTAAINQPAMRYGDHVADRSRLLQRPRTLRFHECTRDRMGGNSRRGTIRSRFFWRPGYAVADIATRS